jgi:hypothetical protein
MNEPNDAYIEKITILFRQALTDENTIISFNSNIENYEFICTLNWNDIFMSIYVKSEFNKYLFLTNKFIDKFPKIYDKVVEYNKKTNSLYPNQYPIYDDKFKDEYFEILSDMKSFKFKFFSYFNKSTEIIEKKNYYHWLKFNNIAYNISSENFSELFNIAATIEEAKNNKIINSLYNNISLNIDKETKININKTINTQIDMLLEKIQKSGIDSLTKEESDFLKNNKYND